MKRQVRLSLIGGISLTETNNMVLPELEATEEAVKELREEATSQASPSPEMSGSLGMARINM